MRKVLEVESAEEVAKVLRKAGLRVTEVTEGDEAVDGSVSLGPRIHVQVPYLGTGLWVVSYVGGNFRFGTARHTIKELLSDVRRALADDAREVMP